MFRALSQGVGVMMRNHYCQREKVCVVGQRGEGAIGGTPQNCRLLANFLLDKVNDMEPGLTEHTP